MLKHELHIVRHQMGIIHRLLKTFEVVEGDRSEVVNTLFIIQELTKDYYGPKLVPEESFPDIPLSNSR